VLVSDVPALRRYWYPVAYADAVAADPVAFRLFGERYVAWRDDAGAVHAVVDRCAHRGARLSQGWVADGLLTCPYHGWGYAGDGRCTVVPTHDHGVPVPARAVVPAIGAVERYGLVWATVSDDPEPVPTIPELDDPGYTLIHELLEEWSVPAVRIIDNGIDVSHVAWVHRNSVGTSSAPRLDDVAVERDGAALRFEASYTVRLDADQRRNTGIDRDLTTRRTLGELVQPLVFRGVLEYPDNGLRHVLVKTATPLDDRTSLFCQLVARNDAPDVERQRAIAAVDRRVQAEDRVLLEAIDVDFPLAPGAEVHTRADRMTVEYRRILASLRDGPTPAPSPTDLHPAHSHREPSSW
jgi:phenylpropionate dioxygenase-like ring-hydroxylating dioxygenase large terminal subunit